MTFTWVDGPFGGTPVTAANLNAAMGVSDAAIAARIADSASATQAQLNATYVPANPTLTVTYNTDGSVASTVESGVTMTFTYNTDGTVNTQTRAGVTKTFTYDANGNVTGAS